MTDLPRGFPDPLTKWIPSRSPTRRDYGKPYSCLVLPSWYLVKSQYSTSSCTRVRVCVLCYASICRYLVLVPKFIKVKKTECSGGYVLSLLLDGDPSRFKGGYLYMVPGFVRFLFTASEIFSLWVQRNVRCASCFGVQRV